MTPEEASANKGKPVARGQDMTVFFTMYHKVLKGKRLDPKGPNSLRLRAARNVAVGRFVEFALQRYNLELDRSGVAADDKTRAQPAAPLALPVTALWSRVSEPLSLKMPRSALP